MPSITIEKRSTWAQYISLIPEPDNQDIIARYSKPPEVSNRAWEPWTGGVFIHYMGKGGSFSSGSETTCRKEIASIFSDHWYEAEDIMYNFLVCPHGIIYEGRGYQRGEANGGRTIDVGGRTLGRNTAFYSIQGMLGTQDEPTTVMLTSMRDLIHHLRYELGSDRKAGELIFPHSADDFPTKCPGTFLSPYANNGSFIDPEPPVSGGTGNKPAPAPPELRIISRAGWGARPPRDVAKVPASERAGFVVHYSAGPPTQTVRAIQNYHMDSNGWWDIGYNFLVDQGGRIYEGRGWDNEGAHTRGYNRSHIAVCFIGRDGDATVAAKRAIRSLYEKTNSVVGRTLSTTYHSALDSTQCPGNDLRSWVGQGMPTDGLSDVVGGGDGTPGDSSVRAVAAQQQAVNGLGHTPQLVVDGIFGPRTEAGVKWLQNKVGTDADGIWGPNTEAAYRAYIGTGTGSNGLTSIRSIASQQSAVNSLGHSPELDVDGIFGTKTEAGVKWLQDKVGVSADGLWGPATEGAYNDYTGGKAPHSDGGLTTIRSVSYQQSAVNGLGHTPQLDVDGIFGPRTEAGVKWLQGTVGVTADGLWGPDTDAAYGRYEDGARLTVDGVFGPSTVSATQQAIGVTADGVWGPDSRQALQQHLNNWADAELTVDGDVGTATVKALQRHLNTMIGAGLTVDGDWGSATTNALQAALNQGRF
ncbi:peptidoglycan-binding protein [Streptomyces sp. NPDC051963]|uniref:peptidoglycan-binding protein n=1 Tax=Streptomyces sp. NPDC051963 TaxID=3365678 RepID=UPI0037CD984A